MKMQNKLFKHNKSDETYKVVYLANLTAEEHKKDKFPLTVVYRKESDWTVWSRLYDDFVNSFTEIPQKICPNKINGSCINPNIFCSYPDCEK